MDPAFPAEMEGDMKDRRKIHFSVPSAMPSQLDPKQAELIRRRRPTPATLFKLTDHASPDDDSIGHQLPVSENGALKPKRATAVYEPPSLKVQRMAEAHMQFLDASQPTEGSTISDCSDTEDIPVTSAKDLHDDTRSVQSKCQLEREVTSQDSTSSPQPDTPSKAEEDSRASTERVMNEERKRVKHEKKGKGK
ncbi:protein phosphatase 1 regulatory subunit 1B-like isoform X2 [Myxocyprinus asiaticus]|uniref:protein phosphatase 1 regulatory subunit 1B-like isoform X2 n=1 Tax=Myxocyprinus asiaticus TaxID=70543 RepID=UPI002222B940|nr:protein phosphatase 1 regulatory subunit 1B-like isoform X2 [Myxocyprinus asiaticus]